MNIKDFVSDIRIWIGLVVLFVAVGGAFASCFKLPTRVDKVEEINEVVEDNVQKLAADIGVYIAVNEEQRKADKEQKELMLKLILNEK